MPIATKINDIIALSQSSPDTRVPTLLSEKELCGVFEGDGTWAASDATFEIQQAAQRRFDSALQNDLEALGNLDMGSATPWPPSRRSPSSGESCGGEPCHRPGSLRSRSS